MQQQRPSKLPLVVGGVLILATIARHRRRARTADWYARAGAGEPHSHGTHDHGHHGDHRHLAARLVDCAERMAGERAVEYL